MLVCYFNKLQNARCNDKGTECYLALLKNVENSGKISVAIFRKYH